MDNKPLLSKTEWKEDYWTRTLVNTIRRAVNHPASEDELAELLWNATESDYKDCYTIVE